MSRARSRPSRDCRCLSLGLLSPPLQTVKQAILASGRSKYADDDDDAEFKSHHLLLFSPCCFGALVISAFFFPEAVLYPRILSITSAAPMACCRMFFMNLTHLNARPPSCRDMRRATLRNLNGRHHLQKRFLSTVYVCLYYADCEARAASHSRFDKLLEEHNFKSEPGTTWNSHQTKPLPDSTRCIVHI